MEPGIPVTRAMSPKILERLHEAFGVIDNQADIEYPPEMLAEWLQDHVGLLSNAADTTSAESISHVPMLCVVRNIAVDYNNSDPAAVTRAGILATNAPDILTETTVDFGQALLTVAACRISESEYWPCSGQQKRWTYDMLLDAEVYGSTLGILGTGHIGQAPVQRASGFSMRVVYHGRSRLSPELEQGMRITYVSEDELLEQADHLVLALPYSKENHHAIGVVELTQMKPTATLTNLACGGIVDDAVLMQVLTDKHIFVVGLDVYEGESKVHLVLLNAEHVVLTPRIAGATLGARLGMVNLVADDLTAALGFDPYAGQPPNLLNPDMLAQRASSQPNVDIDWLALLTLLDVVAMAVLRVLIWCGISRPAANDISPILAVLRDGLARDNECIEYKLRGGIVGTARTGRSDVTQQLGQFQQMLATQFASVATLQNNQIDMLARRLTKLAETNTQQLEAARQNLQQQVQQVHGEQGNALRRPGEMMQQQLAQLGKGNERRLVEARATLE